MITIINYGMGNLGSIVNMFKRIGVVSEVTNDVETIRKAEKLLLPGVGAFDAAMKRIHAIDGLRETLDEKVMVQKKPILGICLGMQLLTNSSEEGHEMGLGWIDATTVRFPNGNGLKIPHMGWNIVHFTRPHALNKGMMDNEQRFYFVHSYYVVCANEEDVLGQTNYGINFTSMVQHENIFGAQFHPEKSHRFGMQLLKNFAEI